MQICYLIPCVNKTRQALEEHRNQITPIKQSKSVRWGTSSKKIIGKLEKFNDESVMMSRSLHRIGNSLAQIQYCNFRIFHSDHKWSFQVMVRSCTSGSNFSFCLAWGYSPPFASPLSRSMLLWPLNMVFRIKGCFHREGKAVPFPIFSTAFVSIQHDSFSLAELSPDDSRNPDAHASKRFCCPYKGPTISWLFLWKVANEE